MKLLLIEDEPTAIAYLRQGLSESSYIVEVAQTAEAGLGMALYHDFDVIVLDINLPDRSGWWVLSELRRHGRNSRILCLTCRSDVADRVRGLDLGADDYLTKPFSFSEFLARLRSITRRSIDRGSHLIQVGDLTIDLIKREAVRCGTVIRDLRPKEFALLEFMARHEGEVLSRTRIVEHVWNADFDYETNVVDVQIKRLREKVDASFETKLIHSVRGVGYVFEPRT